MLPAVLAYGLPRIVIAAIGWAISCIVIWMARRNLDVTTACCSGVAWSLAAVGYIAYMRKLRREFQELRVAKAELKLASLRLMGRRMRQAESAQQLAALAHPLDRAA